MTAEETASHLADWIREWVQAEWELREFSAVTVDEGAAVKQHARDLADHLAAKLAFRAYLAAPRPASAALRDLIAQWRERARGMDELANKHWAEAQGNVDVSHEGDRAAAYSGQLKRCAEDLAAALARAEQP